MTASSDASQAELPLGARWRAQAHAAQEAVLPSGSVLVSCDAPFGAGGLGCHLKEIVQALERGGVPRRYICADDRASSPSPARSRLPFLRRAMPSPVARFSPGLRVLKARAEFDAYAAARQTPAEHLIAFNRQALAQFHAARESGFQSVSLMSGSPHVERVARQHARAYEQYPLERSFGTHIVPRYLAEYEQADRIYVASRYTWESFIEHGIPEERLSLFPLTPDPRYTPAAAADAADAAAAAVTEPRQADTFNVVYVGSISVAKGVALLIEAVRRLDHADLRLALVGGWKTRGMRHFIEATCARDGRISLAPGDPLAHFRTASLCVHPTYEDGFAYAPAEAMACGVPVIVSADTGMRELIEPGRSGLVLPTGDLDALTESIDAAYRGEILSV